MNTGNFDRIVRVIIGVTLLVISFTVISSTAMAWILGIVGAILALTGITGFCLIYRLFGITTMKSSHTTRE